MAQLNTYIEHRGVVLATVVYIGNQGGIVKILDQDFINVLFHIIFV